MAPKHPQVDELADRAVQTGKCTQVARKNTCSQFTWGDCKGGPLPLYAGMRFAQ